MELSSQGFDYAELFLIALNVFGLIFWVVQFFSITFSKRIDAVNKRTYLTAGAIALIIPMVIYFVLGRQLGLICGPIFTWGFALSSLKMIHFRS